MTEKGKETLSTAMRKVASFCIDHDLRLSAGIEYLEKAWLLERLERNGNNRCAVAEIEGIHRNTMTRRLDALGVPHGEPGGKGVVRRSSKQA